MRIVRNIVGLVLTLTLFSSIGVLGFVLLLAPGAVQGGSSDCSNTANLFAPAAAGSSTVVAPPATTIKLDAEQLKVEALIVGIGIARGESVRDIKIALMTAYQESGMRNISYGDRDSLGIYQQRPSSGWGTPAQILDPVYAINKFYAALDKIANRENRTLLDVAMAVQNPSRAAYTSPTHSFMSWEGLADQLLAGVVSTGVTSTPMVYSDNCNTNTTANNNGVGPWQKPLVSLLVTSPWGQRLHPILHIWRLHNGVDFNGTLGEPIYSIGSGTVSKIASDSASGNYVSVDYGGGNTVSYLHMSRYGTFVVGSTVKPGDVLGYVGSTGLSTGPHLHFMWVKSGQNINPVPELCTRGVVVPGPQGCAAYTN